MRYVLMLAFCLSLCVPIASSAQNTPETLIADSEQTRTARLVPLRNGLASLTMVWPMGQQSPQNVDAIQAGLVSVLTGGTTSRTPEQIGTFTRQKGVRTQVSTLADNLLLTLSAPHDVFPETLVHLENLLLNATYTDDWYARELHRLGKPLASITKRPANVVQRLEQYLHYGAEQADAETLGPRFRFGRPSRAILRSENEIVLQRVQGIIEKLPAAAAPSRFGALLQQLLPEKVDRFELPSGIIHFADPTHSETLLMLVNAHTFDSEAQQLGANLLLDYIGANQGSEMFRIIRQELRASYDPGSRFVTTGDKRALLVMNATVEAQDWLNILSRLQRIYEDVRASQVDPDGLRIQYGRLKQRYENSFFVDARWTAEQYLIADSEGTTGNIQIPIFNAFGEVDFEDIIASADQYLPPLEDFLLVVIGGGTAPTTKSTGTKVCSLEKFEPLDRCLEELAGAQQ